MLEVKYPYTSGADGENSTDCLYKASKATDVTVREWHYPNGFKEGYNKTIVAYQPIAAVVTANNKYIHSYASGVIDADDCNNVYDDEAGKDLNPINHAVLVVGYGTDKDTGLDYWLVKNSWNTTWGDKGYVKIKM